MESKKRKRYTEDFKTQAIELMQTGKPVVELAEEFCVSAALLYRWRRGTQVGSAERQAEGETLGADDLRALRRENASLRVENDILKKAAVILGTKSPLDSAK